MLSSRYYPLHNLTHIRGFSHCLTIKRNALGYKHPFNIQAGPLSFAIICNPSHIQTVFKNSKWLSTRDRTAFVLQHLLGLPSHIMPFYQADDTGMATTIRKGSAITRQHDRIQFLQNHNALKYFSSQNLQSLSRRFESVLRRDLGARYDIGEAWRTFPDLYHFLQDLVGRSAIEALMGTKLLEMSPTLVEDFWIFEANSPKFLKLYPRLLNRKGYQARERLVSAVKQWHAFAHDSQPDLYAKTAPDDPDWEPVFGSKFLKVRQQYELQMPALDADARAREDVGLMFG